MLDAHRAIEISGIELLARLMRHAPKDLPGEGDAFDMNPEHVRCATATSPVPIMVYRPIRRAMDLAPIIQNRGMFPFVFDWSKTDSCMLEAS